MTISKLNHERVAELNAAKAGYVDRGDVPGIVTLIANGDEIHVNSVGMKRSRGEETN